MDEKLHALDAIFCICSCSLWNIFSLRVLSVVKNLTFIISDKKLSCLAVMIIEEKLGNKWQDGPIL